MARKSIELKPDDILKFVREHCPEYAESTVTILGMYTRDEPGTPEFATRPVGPGSVVVTMEVTDTPPEPCGASWNGHTCTRPECHGEDMHTDGYVAWQDAYENQCMAVAPKSLGGVRCDRPEGRHFVHEHNSPGGRIAWDWAGNKVDDV